MIPFCWHKVSSLGSGLCFWSSPKADSNILCHTRNTARMITGLDSADATARLLLCGSRGVGGVALTSDGVTSLELLDVEEDEEAQEEEDEEFEEE
jgi:hypothetical protein